MGQSWGATPKSSGSGVGTTDRHGTREVRFGAQGAVRGERFRSKRRVGVPGNGTGTEGTGNPNRGTPTTRTGTRSRSDWLSLCNPGGESRTLVSPLVRLSLTLRVHRVDGVGARVGSGRLLGGLVGS